MQSVEHVSALRAQLWAAGFRPVPVCNAKLGDKTSGKAPIGKQWQIEALDDPPPAVKWIAPHALNTGILCNGLRAIDLDIDDPGIAAQCVQLAVELLPPAPVRYRAGSPRCLLVYRAAEGEPAKLALPGRLGKIEVLGKGQQFVADGEHWEAMAALQWRGELRLDALAPITERQVHDLLAACAPIIGAEAPRYTNGKDRADHEPPGEGELRGDFLRVARDFADIDNSGPPNWDWWAMRVGALHTALGDTPEAWAIARDWSAKNPAYDPAEVERKWRRVGASPYTRLGAKAIADWAARDRRARDRADPREEIPPVGDEPPAEPPPPIFTVTETVREAAEIPRRPWLGPPYLMRRQITMLHGPGGAGKSQLAIGWSVAAILHHTFGRFAPVAPCRVLMGNFEDDIDEQDRRINATVQHFGAEVSALTGRLFRITTEQDATMFALDEHGQVKATEAWHQFVRVCEEVRPDLVCLDPLIVLNAAPEDISTHARRVVVYLQGLAKRLNLALLLAHHDRKGAIGADDQDAARGSGDWAAAVRFEKAVRIMTLEQAGQFGIEEDRRGFYFRVGSESSKTNYAAPEAAEWFQRHAVPINGEMVVRCEPWQPPTIKLAPDQADQIAELIGRGSRFGPYSPQIGNTNRSLGPELARLGIEAPRAQQRAIKQLEDAGRIIRGKWWRPAKSDWRVGLRTEAGEPCEHKWQED